MSSYDYKIYGAGQVMPDRAWRMSSHSHSFHELIVITQGRLLLKSSGKMVIAKPGDVLFYRAGFEHDESSDRRAPVGSLFVAFSTGTSLHWLPLRIADREGRIRQITRWLVEDERRRRTPDTRKSILELLLGELRFLCDAPTDAWLETMLGFIRDRSAHPLKLDDLAHLGGMDKFSFIRRFKKLSGRTPMEELRLTRLNQARTLLLTTSLPIKAIAPAVGIGDEFQLSKLFRRHFDLAPSDLRSR